MNRLKLNADKTDIIWLGTSQKLKLIESNPIRLGDVDIISSAAVKNLGVIFDNEMTLTSHANAVIKMCLYQLRQLRTIRRFISVDAAKTLVNSFIASRVDYCNSLFHGATKVLFDKLQSIINAAARLITDQRKFDHISDTLRDLHWLRVPQRVAYKVATISRRCLLGLYPEYLSSSLISVSSLQGRSHLRSANQGLLAVPRTRTTRISERSFRLSGPRVWNSIPQSLRSIDLADAKFASDLKTYLFSQQHFKQAPLRPS